MVTEQALVKFKELYFQKYNKTLTDEEALEQAISLLNLMKILLKPKKLITPVENRIGQTI